MRQVRGARIRISGQISNGCTAKAKVARLKRREERPSSLYGAVEYSNLSLPSLSWWLDKQIRLEVPYRTEGGSRGLADTANGRRGRSRFQVALLCSALLCSVLRLAQPTSSRLGLSCLRP